MSPGDDVSMVTGWGRTAPTATTLRAVDDADALRAVLGTATDESTSRSRGLIARGLGRSYGDAAQNAGGRTIRLGGHLADYHLDEATGVLEAGGGVTLDRLMRELLPRGWFVPVTPGTRQVTVGGAIACDIHGKNHHVDGSFGQHLCDVTLATAGGGTTRTSPTADPELFWATVGGMGLTGVIGSAKVRMRRVETASMVVDTERASDLDDLMSRMEDSDDEYHYSVAWIDCLARGGTLGRGVLTRGRHARLDELDERGRRRPLAFDPAQRVAAPSFVPSGLLNRLTVSAFNEMWFRKSPALRQDEVQPLARFFHPLDGVADWNRLYGRSGLVQYQVLVPFGAEQALRRMVEEFARSGRASFLSVLKRFGAGNAGHLSFPSPGWTLALDLPAGDRDLAALLDRLDELVVSVGGRAYLAKDSRMRQQHLAAMYPRLDAFRRVRDRVDPNRIFVSDLSRRLDL